MSVYVSTTYFGDGSQVQDALRDLEKLKIKNIELGSNHTSIKKNKQSFSANKQSFSANKLDLKKNTKYIVHNYFPPEEKDFILNIASTRSQIKEKSVKFIKNTIIWCQKNNIKYYTIHPGFFAEAISPPGLRGKKRNFDLKFSKNSIKGKKRQNVIEEAIKVIKHLYDFTGNRIQLLIENQGSKTSGNFTLFDSFPELTALKKSVGRNLKFNFNLAHATLSGINIKNEKTFQFIYENSPFFEVSEIQGIYDSHLPLRLGNGRILILLKNFKDLFKKRNIILEYRNIKGKELLKSFGFINKLLA